MPAGAILAGAAIGAGASLIGGNKAAKAQKKAAKIAAATDKYIYDQSRADQAPYRQIGYQALNQLGRLYGFDTVDGDLNTDLVRVEHRNAPGEGGVWGAFKDPTVTYEPAAGGSGSGGGYSLARPGGDLGGFYESPDYRFRLAEGEKAVNRSAAARGGMLSGATLKALQRFGQNSASQEFGNYTNRLSNLAGIGQTATNATGQAGQAYASGVGNAAAGAGNASAAQWANVSNAINGGINNYLTYQALKGG